MRSDEEILDSIIADGSVDLEEWPELVKRLTARLDHIAHNSFPIPQLPPPPLPPPPPGPGLGSAARRNSLGASQATTEAGTQETVLMSSSETPNEKENAAPTSENNGEVTETPTETQTSVASPPPAEGSPQVIPESSLPEAQSQSQQVPETQSTELLSKTLPPSLSATLTSLITSLETSFSKAPPHTAQRLAELLRNPNQHYRSLPKYLRALQRVMSVTSTVEAFPLPALYDRGPPGVNSTGISGTLGLGNDESLGGALLTPIPWLAEGSVASSAVLGSNSSDDGKDEKPNGVTQGELIRQEQELGIVPVSQLPEGSNQTENVGQTGPPELGAADLGPQPAGQIFPESPKRERTPEETPGETEEPQEKRQKTEEAEPETVESKPEGGDAMDVDSTTPAAAPAEPEEAKSNTTDQPMDTSEDTAAPPTEEKKEEEKASE